MKLGRRTFLKGATALAALPLAPPSLAAIRPPKRRLRPSDPAWPSPKAWEALNQSVGGSLAKANALFETCPGDPNGAACQDALHNMRNPFYVGDQPAGTQVSGWLDAWTPAPSAYALRARSAADVAAAVNFAHRHNLRLVVKGGGHSYQGTSNAPDSLLVWTRSMNQVELHDAFVGQGCAGKVAPSPAVSAGAGALWIDLYHAVTTLAGRFVQGGGCTTVGVAGHVQSGGFGSFSKGFGTAAAGLLEAQIVTADGSVRIANACTNADLFWALKGGGGGNWGVVTRVTLRTHDLPQFFGGASGTIKAASDDAFRRLIARFVAFYAETLFNPHWGEQASVNADNTLKLSLVSQGPDNQQIVQMWQPFVDWVQSAPSDYAWLDAFDAGAGQARHSWDYEYRKAKGNTSMIPDARPGSPPQHAWWSGDQDQVGAFLHGYDSLWLPASLLQAGAQSTLAGALFAASRFKDVGLHFNKGLAGAPAGAIADALQTATNPTMTGAFALAIIADGEAPAYPGFPRPAIDLAAARADSHKIDLAAAALRKIAPGAGSYVSESNYFNPDWQRAFWGTNYAKLVAIKKKYDPRGLFYMYHGPGSEHWSADGFSQIV